MHMAGFEWLHRDCRMGSTTWHDEQRCAATPKGSRTRSMAYALPARGPRVARQRIAPAMLDNCTVKAYNITCMVIRSVRHRGLLRLIRDDDSRELRGDLVPRVRRVLTALIAAPDIQALRGPPGWRIHQLTGNRAGIWSISVSGNWRLTFEIQQGEICDLDLEDYH